MLHSGSVGKNSLTPYRTLDLWRGLACLLVVLYHQATILTVRFPDLSALPFYRLCAFGYLGVQMFFVISGYCIAGAACSTLRRGDNGRNFLQARLRRVYPPLWSSLALFAASGLLASALVAAGRLHDSALAEADLLHKSAAYYLTNLTLTQLIFHQSFLSIVCWTLCYEVAFYFVVGLFLLRKQQNGGETALLTGLHLVTITALIFLIAAPQLRFFPLDLWPQFGLGVLVFDILKHPRQTRPKWWLVAVGTAFCVFAGSRQLGMALQAEPSRLTFAFTLGFALLLLLLHRYDDALSRVLVVRGLIAVGLFSYSLYLTHLLTLGLVNQLFRLTPLSASAHLLILAVCLMVAILAARLFYQFCERPFVHSVRKPSPSAPLSELEQKRLAEGHPG